MKCIALLTLLTLVACADEALPPLVAENVVIRHPLPGAGMSAGFLSLTNNSNTAIRITSVSSPQFRKVEIHESTVEDGIARMRPVGELRIAGGETVDLAPGGLHLMLIGPVENIETVILSLRDDQTVLLDIEASMTRDNSVDRP